MGIASCDENAGIGGKNILSFPCALAHQEVTSSSQVLKRKACTQIGHGIQLEA